MEFNANASKDWRNSLLRVKLTLKTARDLICIKRWPLQKEKRGRKQGQRKYFCRCPKKWKSLVLGIFSVILFSKLLISQLMLLLLLLFLLL